MGFFDNITAAVGLGSGLDIANQWATNLFNKNQADVAWHRQLGASSTAYQRAMADMRLAGLNPMLASHLGGASTPSAAMATGVTPPHTGGTLVSGVQASLERRARDQQDRSLDYQGQSTAAEVRRKDAETANLIAQNPNIKQEFENLQATHGEIQARTLRELNSAAKMEAETPGARAYSRLIAELGDIAVGFIRLVKSFVASQREGPAGDAVADFSEWVKDKVREGNPVATEIYKRTPVGLLDTAGRWLYGKLRSVGAPRASAVEESKGARSSSAEGG